MEADGLRAAGPPRWRVWLQAVRVFSFPASVVPILVAAAFALADGRFEPVRAVAMLVASVACHAGANLANDFHDHRQGIDTIDSLGPSGVIQQGLLRPDEVRRGMIFAFAVATVLGLAIVAVSGWPVLVLAVGSLGAAYFYTGGPRPLGYLALGEVTVFLAMGLGMVLGAYYVLAERVTVPVGLAAVAVGCLVAAILHANNVRDIEPDWRAGKRTLAILFGRGGSTVEFALLVGGAYLAVATMVVVEPGLWPALAVVGTVPAAWSLVRTLATAPTAVALNPVVRGTARLHLRFGVALAVGVVVGGVV